MKDGVNIISNRSIYARLIFSSIGLMVGVSVFCVFSFHYHNYNAGLWGLLSGLAAAIALAVTVGYKNRLWDSRPQRLKCIMMMGCFIQLAGVCGFVAYLVLAISKGQDLVVYGPGYYLTCVWCFMTWKWGFALLLYSRTFLRSYSPADYIVQGEVNVHKRSSYCSVDTR